MTHRSFNILGNIAVVNFPFNVKSSEKKKFALQLLKERPNIKTVLEKSGKFSGRLRKMKTKHLAGEKNKEVLYKENNCVFRFNIDTTYFSPRLSNERKEIASLIKKTDKVLVMFAGVGPYSICIAKNSGAEVYSNEINREANKYAELNIKLNKVGGKVELISGDVKKVAEKIRSLRSRLSGSETAFGQVSSLNRNFNVKNFGRAEFETTSKLRAQRVKYMNVPGYFDTIVMPRPRLKESFLKEAFMLSKKNTKIFYYDFCKVEDENKIIEKIKNEAKKSKKKIKILRIKPAGEIAPYKIRLRVDFKIV